MAYLDEVGKGEVHPEGVGKRGGQIRRGNLHARPAQGSRRGQAGPGADDEGGLGAPDGAGESAESEPGVRHNNDGANAQARVEHRREVDGAQSAEGHPGLAHQPVGGMQLDRRDQTGG